MLNYKQKEGQKKLPQVEEDQNKKNILAAD